MACSYIKWYFNRKGADFGSAEEMELVVGARPTPAFSLTRFGRGPLTKDNFYWRDKASVDACKRGVDAPPVFPDGTRTSEQQATNDARFRRAHAGSLQRGLSTQIRLDRKQKLESKFSELVAKLEAFVVARGYQPSDALNPDVLGDLPKLAEARGVASKLMQEIASLSDAASWAKKQALDRLRDYKRQQRTEQRLKSAHNRVHSGTRGRPIERWIKMRVPIASLTPEQRETLGIPVGQPFHYVMNEVVGRPTKRWTVELTVPNPKAQEVEEQGPA